MGDKNKSLPAKWVWRFGKDNNSLWRRVICARYDILDSDLTWEWKAGSHASPFIKAIAFLFAKGTASYRALKEGMKVVISNGKRGKFWEVTVNESFHLKEMCPIIYALAIQKQSVVNDFGRWSESRWFWEVPLRRQVFDWEKDQWRVFMSLLDCMVLRESVTDALAWSFCSDGSFSMRYFHNRLEEPPTDITFDFNLIWQGICPPKIKLFVWKLIRGRVMVKQVLSKFGCDPAVSLLCPFCNAEEEFVDHLFLLCPWSWNLWNNCMSWFEVVSCASNSLKNWFLDWSSLCISVKQSRAWNSLFFACSWTIWEARNQMVFKGLKTAVSQAEDTVKFWVA
ncbi:hypothetical protein Dsin_019226 [Dipteronia sinensis]|uniref:Reverse transcriptase zinc-binding domain-containing protein n=1 Tax=Dipteronia sinensis TaxID=43782 RepID=A0AAE0E2J5_9ROSI|nr:hypothetical protein Dsin_019226 [Dipteronia sinensis]